MTLSPLAWIILMCVAGSLACMAVSLLVSLAAHPRVVPIMVSYAIGAMLGAVFLDLLPDALEHASNINAVLVTVLAGILFFFLLEKLVLWRHCHEHHCEAHEHPAHGSERASGWLILLGDAVHNFVDGILIAAAFMGGIEIGIVTALAIIAHEIPQETGDFVILIHSGFSRLKAIVLNLLASISMLTGAVLAYLLFSGLEVWVPFLLALAASSLLYVSVADLIPGLHKRAEIKVTALQMGMILLGVLSIQGVQWLIGGSHA